MKKILAILLFAATVPLLLISSPPAQQVLTATGGVVQASIDQNGWRSFQLTLTQAVTFQFIGFPTPAQGNVVVFFTENATGGFAVTFQNWTSPSGTVISISNPCTVTTTANATTVCSFNFNGVTNTWVGVASGGSIPGGSTTQVQYNSSNAFAGSAALTWNNGSSILTVGNPGVSGGSIVIVGTGAGGTLSSNSGGVLGNQTLSWSGTGMAPTALGAVGTLSVTGTGACATITTTSGGAWAGQLTCTGTTGASTLVITTGVTATHSTMCFGSDLTAKVAGAQSAGNATTCTLNWASVTQNDVLTFGAIGF